MSHKHEKYERLIAFCKTLPPVPTAVAYPCDQSSLQGALDAARMGLIAPILFGPEARIRAEASAHDIDLSGATIVDVPGAEAAAAAAVALVR
ncbi:MAG: phosphate acetyltransferase, partial [Burkholderiales bacterium]